ncbi:MAG: RnfABCDGE type electron transport complex subunit B, partial [Clostridia bacterium]|nr:RnfABCDGE type electron transport complex subunit B [Clostridia bacterium]
MCNILNDINWTSFLIVIAILAVLALIFTVLILIVAKVCAVNEDPKIAQVQEKLSGANCGGCGFAGCADFAKALVEGRAEVNNCAATSKENKQKIAEILGVAVAETEPMVAVVKCIGTPDVAGKKYEYIGIETCDAKAAYFGGDKICPSGCLGNGSCVKACVFDAMHLENGVAKCNQTNCTACKSCVKTCPKHLIELIPKSAKVFVACSSNCKGKDVMNACKAGCIGCGL